MKKRLKINGVIIFCAFLLIAFFPAAFFHNDKGDDIAVEILALSFILLGQIIRASGRGFKTEYSQAGRALIQNGPYALVRNPMYLGILLIGLGISALLFKLWVAIIFLLVFASRYMPLVFKEEKKLIALFPRDYPAYRKQVPRIFPSVTKLFKTEISEYLPLRILWLKKEIGTVLIVLFLTLFIWSWKDIKDEGSAIYFREAITMSVIIILFVSLVFYLCGRTDALKKDVPNKS